MNPPVASTRSEGRLLIFASVPEQNFGCDRTPRQLRDQLCETGFDQADRLVIESFGETIRITMIVMKEVKNDYAYEMAMFTCLTRAKIIPESSSLFRAHAQ